MIVVYGIAILITIAVIYPVWFVLIASFSDSSDVANGNVWLWPRSWHLDAYRELFKQQSIWRSYLNTIFYCLVGTFFQLLVNIPAGYAMSRKELFAKKFWIVFFTIPMFINGGLIPTYLTVRQFGFYKSLIAQGSGDLAAKLQDLSDKMKYAAIVVSTLPIMCLYPFLQKYFNQGVMIGSIKE